MGIFLISDEYNAQQETHPSIQISPTTKFKELKSLAINYKDEKELEIEKLKDQLNNFKITIENSRNSYEKILDKTKKFHELIEERKRNAEQKISQMKENALRDIKNISIKISIEAVKHFLGGDG